MKRLSIVFTCDSEPIGLYEIERRLRTAGFKRPQAGSIMDAEQSDELAEAYEQGKQAVFTVVALSYGGAIRKCMRRVAQMCAKHSACEQLDRQEARA